MKKIPSPYLQVPRKLEEKEFLLKFALQLIDIHKKFIDKVDEYSTEIDKKIGPKGEKGDRPSDEEIRTQVNQALEFLSEEYLLTLIGSLIPVVKDGRDGKDGVDARSPTKEELLVLIKEVVPHIDLDVIAEKASKKIKPSVVKEIITKDEGFLHLFTSGKIKFKKEHIDGLEQTLSAFDHQLRQGYLHGAGDTVTAGSNIVITTNSNGQKVISSTGGVGSWSTPPETPQPDGSVTVFTVGGTAPTDVIADGVQYFEGIGYTYAAGQITFNLGGAGPTQYVKYR